MVVFDNADDLDILKTAWPGTGQGSILITSRDFSASFSPAAVGFHVKPFDDEMGASALLSLINQKDSSLAARAVAIRVSHELGGLPLAINQIGGFIVQRRIALKDFLPLYEKNAAKIHARKSGLSAYEHSLSTVWKLSIENLSGDAYTLQRLLAFFDPDKIDEAVVTADATDLHADFGFLKDEIE